MSENRKRTRKNKKFQKSTIGNPTKPHCEDERTCAHEGTANEVEDIDPDIVEDSDADINQDPRCQICRGYCGGGGVGVFQRIGIVNFFLLFIGFVSFVFEEDVWSGTNSRTIASAYCVFEELKKME